MPKFQFIDSHSSEAIKARFPALRPIGLDTEFMRESTFYPQLCLVQIATLDGIYLADPMAEHELDMLWRNLVECKWIVHSARQDIEVFRHASGRIPQIVFDTQIAAGLLGFAPQLGYAGLVKELFGVELDKSHTRADWSRRPLPPAMLEYAAEDVEYLLPARDVLTERLDKLGRLRWAEEDSMALLDPALYEFDFHKAVNRLKGAKNMTGHARAAATRLASWREQEAERYDRPRQWIMKDSVLLAIATIRPGDKASLASIRSVAPATLRRAGTTLLDILAASRDDDVQYRPPPKPDDRQQKILQDMQALVSDCAGELGIAPEIIAPRKELSASLYGDRRSRVFSGWRRELIGTHLLEMLGA